MRFLIQQVRDFLSGEPAPPPPHPQYLDSCLVPAPPIPVPSAEHQLAASSTQLRPPGPGAHGSPGWRAQPFSYAPPSPPAPPWLTLTRTSSDIFEKCASGITAHGGWPSLILRVISASAPLLGVASCLSLLCSPPVFDQVGSYLPQRPGCALSLPGMLIPRLPVLCPPHGLGLLKIPSPQRGLSRPPYLVRLTPLHPPTSDLHHLTFITLLQACGCRVHLSTRVSLVSQPDSRVREGREWLSVHRVTGTQHKTGPRKSTQSWLKG